MEVEPGFGRNPDGLRDIYEPTPAGAEVPLSAFTRFEPRATALAVTHQGQFPAVTLSFNLAPGVALGDAVSAVETATRQPGLPGGIPGGFPGPAPAFRAPVPNKPPP